MKNEDVKLVDYLVFMVNVVSIFVFLYLIFGDFSQLQNVTNIEILPLIIVAAIFLFSQVYVNLRLLAKTKNVNPD